MLLGAALALTRDYATGSRLLEHALSDMKMDGAWYCGALYYGAWSRGCGRITPPLEPPASSGSGPRIRTIAVVRQLFSRGSRFVEEARRVDELQKALDGFETTEVPDQSSEPTPW